MRIFRMSLHAPHREASPWDAQQAAAALVQVAQTPNSNFVIDEGSIITDEMIRGINKPVAVLRYPASISHLGNVRS
jgi:hypothetical protein